MRPHPPLYPLLSERRWESFLDNCFYLSPHQKTETKFQLSQGRVPVFKGPEIGIYLGVSERIVTLMASKPEKFYRELKLQKGNNQFRTIHAPRVFLKVVQHYILDCILSLSPVSSRAHGFIKNRSITTGATPHVGARFLWNIDLKDFFPSISIDRTIMLFNQLGYNSNASTFLARLCCIEHRLPQGAPTSPAISNLIFRDLDDRILDLASSKSITYTRYADDLSFSSCAPISSCFRDEIKMLLGEHDFVVNPRKERLLGPRCRKEVTGLTVNERVTIPRKRRREIRARFHRVSQNPENFTEQLDELCGISEWVSSFHWDEGMIYKDVCSLVRSIQSGELL